MPLSMVHALEGGVRRKRPRKASTAELVRAFTSVMQSELSGEAIARWRKRLADELEQRAPPPPHSQASGRSPGADTAPRRFKPPMLPTSRPRLTAAAMEAFVSPDLLADGQPVRISVAGCIGVEGGLEKLLSRRVVDWLRQRRQDLLAPGGELSEATLNEPARLTKTLSRIVLDTLVCVQARAKDVRTPGSEGAVLEMHTAEQSIAGKQLRGCGVVYCPRGRVLFESALAEARESLEPFLSDAER